MKREIIKDVPRRRKSLRLKDWDYRLPGPYFVTLCTSCRHELFLTETIRESALRIISIVGADLSARIHSAVVATDHIHFLTTLSEEKNTSLPQLVALIKVRITQSFLRAGKPAPTNWQRSFFDHVVRDERDFLKKAGYIDKHPFKEIGTACAQWH
ncbi:MAG: transposase [Endomicrobiales bacterium]